MVGDRVCLLCAKLSFLWDSMLLTSVVTGAEVCLLSPSLTAAPRTVTRPCRRWAGWARELGAAPADAKQVELGRDLSMEQE